jgi:hypothetical protein
MGIIYVRIEEAPSDPIKLIPPAYKYSSGNN